MATISSARIQTGSSLAFVNAWVALAAGDDGEPLQFSQYSDKSVHVSGTFGGASVRIEGSNNGGASWAVLTDPQGNDLVFTADKLELVAEVSLLLRPLVVGGNGTTSLSVHALCKESR